MNALVTYTPKINFGNTAASRANPKQIGEEIRSLLCNQDVWRDIEPYLLPPGICGSRQFDQANVVAKLREAEIQQSKKHGVPSRLEAFGLTDVELWRYIYREIGKVLLTKQGRVIGLLEEGAPTNGEPDVE
jgi:hypothetical protein